MDDMARIERVLGASVARAGAPGGPPRLAAAMRHAVFPGGARVRPRLCLAVARACGEDDPFLSEAAAAALELLHCASLVHDDMPCFDDAALRRGRASVHQAYGEGVALLAGDALIVLAFETLGRGALRAPARLPGLLGVFAAATGAPFGIAAGQAWECEPCVDLRAYQRAKTGALFAAATMAGAASAGAAPEGWRALGEGLGEAYQVADDIRDVAAEAADLGKPIGQDLAHGRPSAALQLGIGGAMRRLESLVGDAVASIPPCPNATELRGLILLEMRRLLPKQLTLQAA